MNVVHAAERTQVTFTVDSWDKISWLLEATFIYLREREDLEITDLVLQPGIGGTASLILSCREDVTGK